MIIFAASISTGSCPLARLRMQRRIVEHRAQPALLAHPADRRDDVGLIEVVGEYVDLGARVLFAIGDEIEQLHARVGAEPSYCASNGLVSKSGVLGPSGRMSLLWNLSA